MKKRQVIGKKGESLALEYLKKKGYKILETNFRFDRGEIDIVAEDQDVLVFVEVKARKTKSIGDPEDAVTERKKRQIWKVAQGYLFRKQVDGKECRFDVIAVESEGGTSTIRHTRDAF